MIAGLSSGRYICYWKSNRLPEERINSMNTSNDSSTPNLIYYGTNTRV